MRVISNNLKEVRKSKKVTQAQLAEQVGCTQRRIADYETGRYNDSLKFIEKILINRAVS